MVKLPLPMPQGGFKAPLFHVPVIVVLFSAPCKVSVVLVSGELSSPRRVSETVPVRFPPEPEGVKDPLCAAELSKYKHELCVKFKFAPVTVLSLFSLRDVVNENVSGVVTGNGLVPVNVALQVPFIPGVGGGGGLLFELPEPQEINSTQSMIEIASLPIFLTVLCRRLLGASLS
jgi:hypothetical protein